MKNIIIFAIVTLGVIIAAILLPMHYPTIALLLYAIIWIMIKFEVIQKMIIAIKKSEGKNISELYWEPIEKILPRIETAMIVLCVYATALLTAELTPLVKPLYWSFTESSRVWLLHIAIMIALIAGSQLSNEYRAVKNISYIVAGVLFIMPTFFEGKVWKIQTGDKIIYEVPEYAQKNFKWWWEANESYEVRLNNENIWFNEGKVPKNYSEPKLIKTITIRVKPTNEKYLATVKIWSTNWSAIFN